MRHNRTIRKLGVKRNHRQAMLRNMVTSLFRHGRITTTDSRAKSLKAIADKLITLGKSGTVHARRLAGRTVRDKEVLKKLFGEIAPEYSDRNGGYTRLIKYGYRKGDNASLSIIELANYEPDLTPKKEKEEK